MLALGNRLLSSDGDASPFASAFTVSLDPRGRTVQFSSAGHPAYLLRARGDSEKLETQCLPIGVRDDEVFPLSRVMKLFKGDILLIASDGVFETRRTDREFLGVDRVLDVVREHQSDFRGRNCECGSPGGLRFRRNSPVARRRHDRHRQGSFEAESKAGAQWRHSRLAC